MPDPQLFIDRWQNAEPSERANTKEQLIHDTGLVSILRQLHDDLDAAVFAAYGWSDLWEMQQEAKAGAFHDFKSGMTAQASADPTGFAAIDSEFQRAWEQELLTRLVTLNTQRATEESNGQIRYLRPEYQKKKEESGKRKESQSDLDIPKTDTTQKHSQFKILNSKFAKRPWPRSLADRVRLIDETLRTTPGPHTTKTFTRANESEIEEILETLTALGRASKTRELFLSVG
ncbi:MAG: hypothetical protein WEB60_05135 [Terrimicrobiaceae bacterium]